MSVLLPASLLSGVRASVLRGRPGLAAAAVVIGVALAGAAAWQLGARQADAERVAVTPRTPAAQRMQLEHCTEGAMLRHDVRWAAACMVVTQQEESRQRACLAELAPGGDPGLHREHRDHCEQAFPIGDGSAECELPDLHARRLYDWLGREEQRCLAEVGALPR